MFNSSCVEVLSRRGPLLKLGSNLRTRGHVGGIIIPIKTNLKISSVPNFSLININKSKLIERVYFSMANTPDSSTRKRLLSAKCHQSRCSGVRQEFKGDVRTPSSGILKFRLVQCDRVAISQLLKFSPYPHRGP